MWPSIVLRPASCWQSPRLFGLSLQLSRRIVPGGDDRSLPRSVSVFRTSKVGTISRLLRGLQDLFQPLSLRRSYLLRVLSATPDSRYVSIGVPTSRGGTEFPARPGSSHFIPPALCAYATIIPLHACNGTSRDPLPASAGHACWPRRWMCVPSLLPRLRATRRPAAYVRGNGKNTLQPSRCCPQPGPCSQREMNYDSYWTMALRFLFWRILPPIRPSYAGPLRRPATALGNRREQRPRPFGIVGSVRLSLAFCQQV